MTLTEDAARIDKALYAALVLATGYGKHATAAEFDEARAALGRLVDAARPPEQEQDFGGAGGASSGGERDV